MWEVVRFWLDLGVDGFRLDALATIFEHPNLPNHTYPVPANGFTLANELNKAEYEHLMQYQTHQPGVHELLKELRVVVDEYPGDRVLIGEDENVAYHGDDGDELHLVFNFPLMAVSRLTPVNIRSNQVIRLAELPPGAWPCNTLGHHDGPRLWTRFGDSQHDKELAQLHLALLLTLKGTPFIYNGDEIGMTDLELTRVDQIRDTSATNYYEVMTQRLGIPAEEAFKRAVRFTRDRCRSPFQWSGEPNSGFSLPGVETWLPVNSNYKDGVNAADQELAADSMLNFYRRMLGLRRAYPALVVGDYSPLQHQNNEVFSFLRRDRFSRQTCLVALNFSSHEQSINLNLGGKQSHLVYTSDPEKDTEIYLPQTQDCLELKPFEIYIAELK